MLVSRSLLFLLVQVLIAILFFFTGKPDAWNESVRWWLFSVILANLASIYLLVRLFKAEGKRYLTFSASQRQPLARTCCGCWAFP